MTTRTYDLAHATALVKDTVRGLIFVDLLFDSGPLYLNNSDRNIIWGSNIYTGIGMLGSVGQVEEVTTIESTSIQLTMTGLDPEIVKLALNEHVVNREVNLYLVLFDEALDMNVSPLLMFRGIIDHMTLGIDNDTATVTVECTSRLKDWERLRVNRWNNYDHRRRYPSDRSFEYMEQVVDKEVAWGMF